MIEEILKRKILFFVHCISFSPSTERRVMDYKEYFLNAGIKSTFLSYTPTKLYRLFNSFSFKSTNIIARLFNKPVHIKIGIAVLFFRWISLIRLLLCAHSYDIIFIQKVLAPIWFVYILKKINCNIVFDFDDAVFLRKRRRSIKIIRNSMLVFAGSHYNLDFAKEYNKNSIFLPTPVQVNNFSIKKTYKNEKDIVIGWIGSISTLPSLGIVKNVVDNLSKEFPKLVLRIIGFGNKKELIPEFNNTRLDLIYRIPYKTVPDAIAKFDIGIMPLINREWDKGKCVGKALEYMATGVPCVISRFGENIFAIKDGENGYLAESEKEWFEKLSKLIRSWSLRETIGKKGRETVEKKYSTEVCAENFIKKLVTIN